MAMCKISSADHFTKRSIATSTKDPADAHWLPNTDVYLIEDALVIKVELAGMSREHLEITIEGNALKIRGQRPDGCRPPKCTFQVMEINYGNFERLIELPPGYDPSRAKAAYQNGFLRIAVPVAPKSSNKVISVTVDGE